MTRDISVRNARGCFSSRDSGTGFNSMIFSNHTLRVVFFFFFSFLSQFPFHKRDAGAGFSPRGLLELPFWLFFLIGSVTFWDCCTVEQTQGSIDYFFTPCMCVTGTLGLARPTYGT